jgi:hypothetical protein
LQDPIDVQALGVGARQFEGVRGLAVSVGSGRPDDEGLGLHGVQILRAAGR